MEVDLFKDILRLPKFKGSNIFLVLDLLKLRSECLMAGGSSNIFLRIENVRLCEVSLLIFICEEASAGLTWLRPRFERLGCDWLSIIYPYSQLAHAPQLISGSIGSTSI